MVVRSEARRRERRRGFTLLELIAVMVVMALLAAATVYSLSGHVGRARVATALEMLSACDRLARQDAVRFQRYVLLEVDTDSGTVTWHAAQGDRAARPRRLPGSVAIEQVRTEQGRSSGGVRLEVLIHPRGTSDTYALKLSGPDEAGPWLLLAGITGQATRLANDDDVEQVFRSLQTARVDAR